MYRFPDITTLFDRLMGVRIDKKTIRDQFCGRLLSLAGKECDCRRFFSVLDFARNKYVQVNGDSDVVIIDGLVPAIITVLVPDSDEFREELLHGWHSRN